MEEAIERLQRNGAQLAVLRSRGVLELHITAPAGPGGDMADALERVADVLREFRAQLAALTVFCSPDFLPHAKDALGAAFGEPAWPATVVASEHAAAQPLPGAQAIALAGASIVPLRLNGRVVGVAYETAHARWALLGGVLPHDPHAPAAQQAQEVFSALQAALALADMGPRDILRTWFFLGDILSWYETFNRERSEFFAQAGVLRHFLPASTGIGARNPSRAAIQAAAVGLRPHNGAARVFPVPSPLQGPPLKYGSAFSRAVEVALPGCRRLYVSGTASIDRQGASAHLGDAAGQIQHTMNVVEAILHARGMTWADVTRAVAYVKRGADVKAFFDLFSAEPAARLPVLVAQSDICRDELLFELEVDAMCAGP